MKKVIATVIALALLAVLVHGLMPVRHVFRNQSSTYSFETGHQVMGDWGKPEVVYSDGWLIAAIKRGLR